MGELLESDEGKKRSPHHLPRRCCVGLLDPPMQRLDSYYEIDQNVTDKTFCSFYWKGDRCCAGCLLFVTFYITNLECLDYLISVDMWMFCYNIIK